jgi:hypothetical protein
MAQNPRERRHSASEPLDWPGVVVRRAVAHDDRLCSLFEITFWKQFKTYASVTRIGT